MKQLSTSINESVHHIDYNKELEKSSLKYGDYKKRYPFKSQPGISNVDGLTSLLDQMCYVMNYSSEDIKSKSKQQHLVFARRAFIIIAACQFPQATLSVIGKAISRDHATVIYQQAKFLESKKFDPFFYDCVIEVVLKVQERYAHFSGLMESVNQFIDFHESGESYCEKLQNFATDSKI